MSYMDNFSDAVFKAIIDSTIRSGNEEELIKTFLNWCVELYDFTLDLENTTKHEKKAASAKDLELAERYGAFKDVDEVSVKYVKTAVDKNFKKLKKMHKIITRKEINRILDVNERNKLFELLKTYPYLGEVIEEI